MNEYQRRKESARTAAIEWQHEFDGLCLSWGELAGWQDHWAKLARRYGLVNEFRENGII